MRLYIKCINFDVSDSLSYVNFNWKTMRKFTIDFNFFLPNVNLLGHYFLMKTEQKLIVWYSFTYCFKVLLYFLDIAIFFCLFFFFRN